MGLALSEHCLFEHSRRLNDGDVSHTSGPMETQERCRDSFGALEVHLKDPIGIILRNAMSKNPTKGSQSMATWQQSKAICTFTC